MTVEAASPVLIEKVRTVVTDGNGRYQITELRPGSYTVTFSLAGFNTVKREGVELAGTGTSAVDAEMRVGALEETITVTGEAPVVDTQSVTKQQVLSSDAVNALPSARNYFGLARMIPGTSGGGNDVGGSLIQDVGQSVTVHGSKNTDQRVTTNGVSTMTLQAGGNIGGQTPDVGSAAEVTVDTTSLSAELPTGGVRINFVPRDGGNSFSNSTFFSTTGESLQGNNFSDELRAAGLSTPNKILKAIDLNESIGGPIKRDRVWFWFSTRINSTENEAAILKNANAFNPNAYLYVPLEGQPGVNKGEQFNNSLRVTWQATPKVKVAGTYKADKWCNCPNNISGTIAPEAARDRRFPNLKQVHGEVTSPITSKLLFEGVYLNLYERWGNMHLRPATGSITEEQAAVLPQMISVVEQSRNLRYRALNTYNNTKVPSTTYRVAFSYVTGTHAFKVGHNNTIGFLEEYNYMLNPIEYRFNNGVPNQLTQRAFPVLSRTNLDRDMGFYAQDRWTLDRLTVNLAARFDNFKTSFPEQNVGSSQWTPGRNITFAAQDNINWKDFTYRSGLAYDVFGTGKTAVKVAFNKYLLGQTLNGLGRDPNPTLSMANTITKVWNDANGNFVPDCDLLVVAVASGECSAASGLVVDPATGQRTWGIGVPTAQFDADLITGWNHRQTNWELTASVQQEIARGIAVDVGYFRRIWANFRVTDNLAVDNNSFDTFAINVPSDSRLTTSGQTIGGYKVLKPEFVGLTNEINKLSTAYGDQKEHWDGVDASIQARLQNGLMLQAGMSTGRTYENNCEIIAALPEMLNVTAGNASNTPQGVAQWRSAEHCERSEPLQTSFKGYGVYTIPRVGVQVSGSFRSVPGTSLASGITIGNTGTYTVANTTTLGRALGSNQSTVVFGIEEPSQSFTERRNELDMRIGKILRMGRYRSSLNIDLFNAINNDSVIVASQAYASYLRPIEILNARVLKFTATFEF